MFNINKNSKKGVSLYFVMMILTILMIITFSMSAILISEINVMSGMGRSVFAFFAAESGIEEALLANRDAFIPGSGTRKYLDNESSYIFTVYSPGEEGCLAISYCIKSVGSYSGANRAIWIAR